jgi:hypothetical protein
MSEGRSSTQVVFRVRPSDNVSDRFLLDASGKSISIRQTVSTVTDGVSKQELLTFGCEAALQNASQERTFEVTGRPVADAVLEGYNGTILAYGQTGAGKSFTMVGSQHNFGQRGLAARCIAHVFREAGNRPQYEYRIRFSCLEIYNDAMHDLLASLPNSGPKAAELSLVEVRGRVEVKGLSAIEVESEEEALKLLFTAEANRAVSQHQLNQHSSRSHVLYMLRVDRRSKVANGALTSSRLTLVDLAGSERLKKSSAHSEPSAAPDAKMQVKGTTLIVPCSLRP